MPTRPAPQGHALVETLVVTAALLPLLVLLPAIGKLQDLRHATLMASRAVAFDAAWHHDGSSGWTDAAAVAEQVRARHFGRHLEPVRTGQRLPEGDDWAQPLWSTAAARPWIARPSDVRIGFGSQASADRAQGFSAAGDGRAFNLQPLAGAGRMGLAARGAFTGRVEVPLARWPEGIGLWQPFDRLDLTLSAETSLLIDGWTARSPGEVERRSLAVTAVPQGVRTAAQGLAGIGVGALELGRLPPPRIADAELWRDVVPQDRLRDWGQP